nr:PREDICTED: AP-1 complex subunit sigma-3 [Apteryx mantelli mantelli]
MWRIRPAKPARGSDKQERKDKGHAASLRLVPVSLRPPTSLPWCRGPAWTQPQRLKSSSSLLFSGPEAEIEGRLQGNGNESSGYVKREHYDTKSLCLNQVRPVGLVSRRRSQQRLSCQPPKIHFILLFSRQGKLRLQKWYTTLPEKEKKKITREIVQIILARNQKTSSFVDWKDLKLVYKRYASLYFCCAIEDQDNELLTLEVVHRYVELLDRYFGNVCELDIIFNFEKAYFILDEFIMGGEVQETSKKSAVKAIEDSDMLQETVEEYMNKPAF